MRIPIIMSYYVYHVIVSEYFFGSGLHFVVVDVANGHCQRASSRHCRVAGVFDHDRYEIFFLLFSVERSEGRNNSHSVTVRALWKRKISYSVFFNTRKRKRHSCTLERGFVRTFPPIVNGTHDQVVLTNANYYYECEVKVKKIKIIRFPFPLISMACSGM